MLLSPCRQSVPRPAPTSLLAGAAALFLALLVPPAAAASNDGGGPSGAAAPPARPVTLILFQNEIAGDDGPRMAEFAPSSGPLVQLAYLDSAADAPKLTTAPTVVDSHYGEIPLQVRLQGMLNAAPAPLPPLRLVILQWGDGAQARLRRCIEACRREGVPVVAQIPTTWRRVFANRLSAVDELSLSLQTELAAAVGLPFWDSSTVPNGPQDLIPFAYDPRFLVLCSRQPLWDERNGRLLRIERPEWMLERWRRGDVSPPPLVNDVNLLHYLFPFIEMADTTHARPDAAALCRLFDVLSPKRAPGAAERPDNPLFVQRSHEDEQQYWLERLFQDPELLPRRPQAVFASPHFLNQFAAAIRHRENADLIHNFQIVWFQDRAFSGGSNLGFHLPNEADAVAVERTLGWLLSQDTAYLAGTVLLPARQLPKEPLPPLFEVGEDEDLDEGQREALNELCFAVRGLYAKAGAGYPEQWLQRNADTGADPPLESQIATLLAETVRDLQTGENREDVLRTCRAKLRGLLPREHSTLGVPMMAGGTVALAALVLALAWGGRRRWRRRRALAYLCGRQELRFDCIQVRIVAAEVPPEDVPARQATRILAFLQALDQWLGRHGQKGAEPVEVEVLTKHEPLLRFDAVPGLADERLAGVWLQGHGDSLAALIERD